MIDPIKSGALGGAATPVKGQSAPAANVEKTADRSLPASSRPDDVEVSGTAHELQARSAGEIPPAGELEPARLRELARRVSEGHYNTPEVLDQVSRRVMDHLDGNGA